MQKLVAEQRLIVDLKKIDGMQSATLSDEGLIGTIALLCKLTRRDDIKAVFPGLVEAAYLIDLRRFKGRPVSAGICVMRLRRLIRSPHSSLIVQFVNCWEGRRARFPLSHS